MCKVYIADFPKADYSTFHGRLNFILSRAGYASEHEKIAHLSKFSGRKNRTVKRWLLGLSLPQNDHFLYEVLKTIDYAECVLWVFYKKTNIEMNMLDPWGKDLARNLASMSEWQKRQFLRYSIRILNKDKKVERLMAQKDAGLISHDHFLSLM